MKPLTVFTAITGRYDLLLNHAFQMKGCQYVCFTDDECVASHLADSWEIRPLQYSSGSAVENQRWHKLHPHELFPDDEYSLWIDANIDILTSDIFERCSDLASRRIDIAASVHPKRDCVYQEFTACRELQKDNVEVLNRQEEQVRELGFPENRGLYETGILFRRHNASEIVTFSERWWEWLSDYSIRDQLSFTVTAWQQGVTITEISKDPYNTLGNAHVRLLPHVPEIKDEWDKLTRKYLQTEATLRKKEGWLDSIKSRFEVKVGENIRRHLRRLGLIN